MRREDAYRQMYKSCGGKYKIVKEDIRSEGGTINAVGNDYHYHRSEYVYIEFECAD